MILDLAHQLTSLVSFLFPYLQGWRPGTPAKSTTMDAALQRELIDAIGRSWFELHGFWFNLEVLCRVIDLPQPLRQYLANPAVKRGCNFICPGLFTTNVQEKRGGPRIRYFLIYPNGSPPMNWMQGAEEVRVELARQPDIDEVLQASRARRRNLSDSMESNPGQPQRSRRSSANKITLREIKAALGQRPPKKSKFARREGRAYLGLVSRQAHRRVP